MVIKYLDDEDYFMCASGLFPARINDDKNTYITIGSKKYLTHFDTATKTPDFTCKLAVVLAVAAAVFFALLASTPIGWAILAGLAVGVGIGMTLCGVMMAAGREWHHYECTVIVLKERHPLPADSYMTCALGGVITWQPQITSPGIAVWTGIRNLGFATLEGVMYGYAAYGCTSLFTAAGRAAFFPNMLNGLKLTYGKLGLALRGVFAAENVSYNAATGQYDGEDKNGWNVVGDAAQTFFGETAPYISIGTKIVNGKANEITGGEIAQAIAIPLSFVGINIQATGATEQIPKSLRGGAVKIKLGVKGLFSERAYIDGIEKGSLSNEQARKWYLEQEKQIPELIDKSLSLEAQAKQAFELRNKFRTQARELMAERNTANQLNASDKNYTWEEIVEKTKNKGFEGDQVYEEIIKSSQRSRSSVNEKLGLDE